MVGRFVKNQGYGPACSRARVVKLHRYAITNNGPLASTRNDLPVGRLDAFQSLDDVGRFWAGMAMYRCLHAWRKYSLDIMRRVPPP